MIKLLLEPRTICTDLIAVRCRRVLHERSLWTTCQFIKIVPDAVDLMPSCKHLTSRTVRNRIQIVRITAILSPSSYHITALIKIIPAVHAIPPQLDPLTLRPGTVSSAIPPALCVLNPLAGRAALCSSVGASTAGRIGVIAVGRTAAVALIRGLRNCRLARIFRLCRVLRLARFRRLLRLTRFCRLFRLTRSYCAVIRSLSHGLQLKGTEGTCADPHGCHILGKLKCHASNYSSHLLQLYCKINPTSPSYHLS